MCFQRRASTIDLGLSGVFCGRPDGRLSGIIVVDGCNTITAIIGRHLSLLTGVPLGFRRSLY